MKKSGKPITRRDFGKKTGIGMLAGMAALGGGCGSAQKKSVSAGTESWELLRKLHADGHSIFACIADTHIHEKSGRANYPDGYPSAHYTARHLRSAIDQVNQLPMPCDFVIFCGDLTDTSYDGEWDHFFEIVSELKVPYYLTLGNHDHSDWDSDQWPRIVSAIEKGIRSSPLCRTPAAAIHEDGLYYTAEEGGWRLLALDSLQSGDIGLPQRQWLEETLRDPSRPTIVSMHRPIVTVGNWVDDARFRDKKTISVLLNTSNMKAFLSGHTHCGRTWYYLDAVHAVAPAMAYGIGDGLGFRILAHDQENISLACSCYLGDLVEVGIVGKTKAGLIVDRAEIYEYDPLYNPLSLPRKLYGKKNEPVIVPANRYAE
jgi:3',5'-cyclic-AMP phosphodiesterase